MLVFSPFFIDLTVGKKAHIMGLIFSAIYFKGMHSESCVMPMKLTVISPLNPFCIYSYLFTVISIIQHGKCLYKEKVVLFFYVLVWNQDRIKYDIQRWRCLNSSTALCSPLFCKMKICVWVLAIWLSCFWNHRL